MTNSKSRMYDSKKGKYVRTNRFDRVAERQEQEHAERIRNIQELIHNPKIQRKYTERQFMGLPKPALQPSNNTRRTKRPRVAFRSSKLRQIFDQFNENRA